MSKLDAIDHFVVLMLENRSFDNLLGTLRPASPQFDGLTGNESNKDWRGKSWPVTATPDQPSASNLSFPDPDPGELWSDMNLQIYGAAQVDPKNYNRPLPNARANMSGFVQSYTDWARNPPFPFGRRDPRQIMGYYDPHKHLPALAALADNFAVCDCWHASAPCQTWPNRFFVHTASAAGYENNAIGAILDHVVCSDMPTIYRRLADAQKDFAIFHHGVAQSFFIPKLFVDFPSNFHLYNEKFEYMAAQGTLPSYTFIEPRYYADFGGPPPWINLANDQHPPHIVTFGDQLVASVYNALRANEDAWKKTMLIVIFDEHGGCYDHRSPGRAASPGDANKPWSQPNAPFAFDRFGVRVPAVIASPYVEKGSVLRPAGYYPGSEITPFDHTSVISTLRQRFSLGAPLTDRDTNAPTLECALQLASPDNMGPKTITPSSYDPGLIYKILALFEPWDDFRKDLHDALRRMKGQSARMGAGLDRLGAKPEQMKYIDRHETGGDPKEDDGVRSDAGAIWAHATHSAFKAMGLRK